MTGLSEDFAVVIHEQLRQQATGIFPYRREGIGDRQREQLQKARNGILNVRCRVSSWSGG